MTRMYNAENERIKRRYFIYLKEARRRSEDTVDIVAKALNRFETFTKFKDFKAFHIEQAIAFKRSLADQRAVRSGMPLSEATRYGTLKALRNFFHWLANEPGFRSKIRYSDAEYFNLSEKEARVAKAHRDPRYPSLDQIYRAIAEIPKTGDVERRNRALIAFAALTGARDSAIASFKLKHVELDNRLVRQDAREVRTKASKTFTTWFFPVGMEFETEVVDWVRHLHGDLGWGPDDPVFPATKVVSGPGLPFTANGIDRRHWATAGPIRAIFKEAFERSGQPYFNPHSFRKTLAVHGERVCTTWEEMQAWAQNLGHESLTTTFGSYGQLASRRQGELISSLKISQGT